MKRDQIVEEIREIREARAARFDFDPRAIAEDAKQREKESGHRVVMPRQSRPTK
jgi:hypothetical protein